MNPKGREREPAILVFDGVCNLCNASVDFLIRRDRRAAIRFASNQSAIGRRLLAERGIEEAEPQTVYLIEGQRVLSRSSAVLQALARLGGPWRLALVARVVPRVLRDFAYRLVARNRYRLFGKRETCRLPTPEERARFLADPPPPMPSEVATSPEITDGH